MLKINELGARMNFIDKAFKDIDYGQGFLYALKKGIEDNPEVRDELNKYPEWVEVVVSVIDYEMDYNQNGLQPRSYKKEAEALKKCHLKDEAEILLQISEMSTSEDLKELEEQLYLERDEDIFWETLFGYIDGGLWNYHNPDDQYDL